MIPENFVCLEVTNLIGSVYHNELYPGSMLWVWALKHLMFHHGQDQLKYTNQVDPWYRSKNSVKLQIWLPFRNFLWIQLLGQGIIFEMGISGDPNRLCFSSNRLNIQLIVVEACLKYWNQKIREMSDKFRWSESGASREFIRCFLQFDRFTNHFHEYFSVFLFVQNNF